MQDTPPSAPCEEAFGLVSEKAATIPDGFDYTKSTEENYGVHHFLGDFATIRPLLDYTYHRKYSDARTMVQDQLIKKILNKGDHDKASLLLPWVVFTAGAMGAGKGYVVRWMDKNGYLPLRKFVCVDPDAIRQELPEWPGYVKVNPELAGQRTQKEAGCIAEILGYAALRKRYNVIFDGSLRDCRWYKKYFAKLRDEYPGIRLMILHITADREEVLRRAEERAKRTGRVVPPKILLDSMEAVPISVRALAPLADFVCEVQNFGVGQEPRILRTEGAPFPAPEVNVSWDLMKHMWDEVDLDRNGELSVAEVQAAFAKGLITEAVLNTVDLDRDGMVSVAELEEARRKAVESSCMRLR